MMRLFLPLILLAVVVLGSILAYNRLVALRQGLRKAFAQVDVQLKRRYDLIPNLVETAKGYLTHERETLESVIEARTRAQQAQRQAVANPEDPTAMAGLIGAERQLGGALGRLFALSEAYPELKADRTMVQLQQELAATEDRVASARQAYNEAAMRYNTYRESFPQNTVAGMLGFAEVPSFELDSPDERAAPRVSF
jgi:LemA protein